MTTRRRLHVIMAAAALLASPARAFAQPAAAVTTGAVTGTMPVDGTTLRTGRRVSKVVGAQVYNDSNESVGEIDDILLPRDGGTPVAIISVGGFLGIGAKLVAVPYDRLATNPRDGRWQLAGATRESLGALPTFTYDTANGRG